MNLYIKKISKLYLILIVLTLLFSILFSLIFSNIVLAFYPDTTYVWSENTIETSATQDSNFLDLSCESAILIEQTTGTILYEKDSHAKLHPASVTKIMTILLIMEALESRSNFL